MLLVVALRLQAVHKGHFGKISSERPSDGPIVFSSSLKHLQHHFGGHWPTSISEVHWGHVSACEAFGPCNNLVDKARRVLTVGATSCMQLVLLFHIASCTSHVVNGSSEASATKLVPLRIFMRNSVKSLISWSSRVFAVCHVLMLWTTSRVSAVQIAFTCMSSCTLKMVYLSWQAVCEDHCHGVVAGQPSDGPVVMTELHGHV